MSNRSGLQSRLRLSTSTSKTTTKVVSGAVTAAIVSAPVLGIAPFTTQKANAYYSSRCQCVQYVKNRYGISTAVGHAKNMKYSLPRLGFHRTRPRAGAVVVMQPSFPGTGPYYGHVGIVTRVLPDGTIRVRGANQGGRQREAGCRNVNTLHFAGNVFRRRDVSFWAR
jgi:surface antigen